MNKKIIIVLLLVLTTLLSSCEDPYDKVPLILYNETDPYIAEFKEHILNEASGNITIDSYDSQNSQLLQNEYIKCYNEKGNKWREIWDLQACKRNPNLWV